MKRMGLLLCIWNAPQNFTYRGNHVCRVSQKFSNKVGSTIYTNHVENTSATNVYDVIKISLTAQKLRNYFPKKEF